MILCWQYLSRVLQKYFKTKRIISNLENSNVITATSVKCSIQCLEIPNCDFNILDLLSLILS